MNRMILLICLALCMPCAWAGWCRDDSQCNRAFEDCVRNNCVRKANNNQRDEGCPNGWRPSNPSFCNSENDCQQQPCQNDCKRDWNYNANRCDQCKRKYACKNRKCCYNN